MCITVRLFALLREKAGTDTVHVEVPEGACVADALHVLESQHPVLAPHLAGARVSLQMDFVQLTALLSAGDELAIIPPVSGGI